MSRILLILLLFCGCLITACKKEAVGIEAERAQAAIDDKIISDYLAANPGLNAKRIDTTGVHYIVIKEGTGTALFTNSTRVIVGYTGKLLTTGEVFAKTDNIHPSFELSKVIRGWRLGIPQIKKGGIVRLLIPSRYAYGPYPQPELGKSYGLKNGLPASAILDFEIELFDIIN
jgi:FKBP-type peptidyl-prolyl cis-trans isomerase FkpA